MKALTPFIVIAICIGMYFIYISPTIADIQSLSTEKASYDNVLQQSKDLTSERDSLLATYNNISQSDITRLDKVVPDTFDGVTFANDINTIASHYGITVKDMKFNEPNAADRTAVGADRTHQVYKTTTVTFALDGQYQAFESFLKDVETSLRLIDVTLLSARALGAANSPNQKIQPGNTIEYTVQVNTYSLK